MQPLELVVDDVAAGGDGIGRGPDGRVVFVRGAIPGDRVRVEVTEDRPRLVRGVVGDVVSPSADRVGPPCTHVADGCGGCGWQHVDPDAQRRFKVRIVEESLRRIGRMGGAVRQAPPLPELAYRTTVRCLVVDGRAALRAARSHEPVPVEHCLVAHPAVDDVVSRGRFPGASEVTVRAGARTGDRLVVVDPSADRDLELPEDVRVVGVDALRSGERAWFTDRVGDRTFRISARSFFQSRTDGAEALVTEVGAAGDGSWGSGRLLDLYGGVGLFAACLGDGMETTVVEASRSSAADARQNLADRDAKVIPVAAERWRPSAADIVVADPPRAGLGADVVARIAATGASRVVLVSCDAASFARDARLLGDVGYGLGTTTLVDLFPHTPHVELVARFDALGLGAHHVVGPPSGDLLGPRLAPSDPPGGRGPDR